MTVRLSFVEAAPSVAVSRRTYVPPAENDAVVFVTLALPNVTVPGPLNFDHVVVSVPLGNPSSLAAPCNIAMAGSVMVWSVPALAVGGALTMIVTLPVFVARPTLVVGRSADL